VMDLGLLAYIRGPQPASSTLVRSLRQGPDGKQNEY
jgi:hypothetical protein